MAKIKLNKEAFQKTNAEFYKRHPERKNRPLTQNASDAKLRQEWLTIYKKHAGDGAVKNASKIPTAPTCGANGKNKKVYVYLYVAAGDGHGHVGLILEQKDGSYIRYSQAAENANLQGWDRYEYFAWMQKVVVRIKKFSKTTPLKSIAPGSKMIQVPTNYPESIQKAVNQYIADESYYHVVTNNCADFVNDTINAASDVNVSDHTKPIDYYSNLLSKFSNCTVLK